MNVVYIACLAFGLTLALIAAFSGGGDTDAGGVDTGGGLDISGDVDLGGDAHGHIHSGGTGHAEIGFPWFSPAVIGTFFGGFGAGGLIAIELFGNSLVGQLAMALGSGALLGAAAGFVIQRLIKAAESTSQVTNDDLLHAEAEVITEIPEEGVGEVALVAAGARMTFPARSETGERIGRQALVEVSRVVGGTLYVREHIEERLRRLREPPQDSGPEGGRGT